MFSTGGAAIKYCTLGSWQVASFRSLVAACALVLLLPGARRGWSPRVLLVGCAYAATMVLFVTGNKLTTSAATIFLQSTAPLYLLLLGPWLLSEKVHARDLAMIGLLGSGLVMMLAGSDAPMRTAPDPFTGNIVAALSGVAWALTIGGLRWLGRDGGGRDGSIPAVVAGNVIAGLACLPFALRDAAGSVGLPAVGSTDAAVLLYLGVFQIGLAYVLVTSGIGHVGALQASLLLLFEPVLNPLWAWLVHGETPGVWTQLGGLLILAPTLLQARRT